MEQRAEFDVRERPEVKSQRVIGGRIAAVGAAVVLIAAGSVIVPQMVSGSGAPGGAGVAAAAGTIVTASAPSAALHQPIDYNIYLPTGYEGSGRRYPSLYLLHGRGDTMAAWTREKADLDRLIADGAIPPMIVVMPDAPWSGGGSWYVDSRYTGKDYPGVKAETALTRDLVGYVDATYRTIDDRASRAVGGYSMGGYGALRYTLAHQDVFSAGLVLSPAVYTPAPPRDSSTRDYGAFGVGRAKFDAARYTALNYPKLLKHVDPARPLHFFLAVGDDEYINPKPVDARHDLDFETAVAYNALKRVPGITAEMRERNGGHDWDVWTPAFVEGVTDLARYLRTGDEPPAMSADLIGTAGDEWAGGVVPSSDGGATVALATTGSLGGSSAGGLDVAVTRRSADGTALWTTQFGNAANQRAYGAAAGADGRVYVAGYTGGDLDGAHAGNAADDAFVAAFSDSGMREWVTQFGDAAAADRIYAVTADGTGGVYVAGYTKGSIDGTTANAGDKDVFVARIAATGVVSWKRQFGSVGEDKGLAVALLDDGVAVAGVAGDAMPGATSAGGGDGFVAAFDGSGTRRWIDQIGSDAWDLFYGLTATSTGGLVAVGTTEGAMAGSPAGGTDAVAVSVSATGAVGWTRQWGTAADDSGINALPAGDGAIRVVGATSGAFGPAVGGVDLFETTLAADGTVGPSTQFGTTADDGLDPYAEPNLFAATTSDRIWISGVTYGNTLGAVNSGSGDVFLVRQNVQSGPGA